MPTPITWDKTGEKRYESGVNHGVLYPQANNGTYPNGYAWNGLTGVTESPDGAEPTDLWADNIKYASLRSAETFGGTIEAYTYPDEFAECDGSVVPAAGVKLGQQKHKPFGLCYRTEIGDDADPNRGYLLHIVYNATASPSEKAYETINDSPDAITFSWEFDTTPIDVAGGYKPVSTITIDSTKIDATALSNIENVLYGTTSADARLPLPDELLTMVGSSTTYTYAEVASPAEGANPKLSGWYESDGAVTPTYTLTNDTAVASGKTYYTRVAVAA